ncbi:MAG: acylphosphatase [Gammaproteobacteria bacterium]
MDPVCRRFFVSGRVQGVGFRYATAAQARRLGLMGHARNLDDGRVEVLACGDQAALDELGDWLNEGPPAARVRAVTGEDVSGEFATDGFRII